MPTAIDSFDGILSGREADLTPQAAEGLLTLGFSKSQQQHMSELAAKARSGELTEDERLEANNFEQISSLLGILQSHARVLLKRSVS